MAEAEREQPPSPPRWKQRQAAPVLARDGDALGDGGVVEAGAVLRVACLG